MADEASTGGESNSNRSMRGQRAGSSFVPKADSVDEDMLKRAIRDAGRWAFGIVAVEVWVFNRRIGKLSQPAGGGMWIDPTYINSFLTDDDDGLPPPTDEQRLARESLEKLIDVYHPDYISPKAVSPGIGLSGALWSEADNMGGGGGGGGFRQETNEGLVIWRDIVGLAEDPDQPPNERLHTIANAGIGLAAGVPFQLGKNFRGIVVYMTRKTADPMKLRTDVNEKYLNAASAVIGAVAALRGPRHAAIDARRKDREVAVHRIKQKMLMMIRQGINMEKVVSGEIEAPDIIKVEQPTEKTPLVVKPMDQIDEIVDVRKETALSMAWDAFTDKSSIIFWKAYHGGGVFPPPAMSWSMTGFVSIAMLITTLVVSLTSHILDHGNPHNALPAPAFAAMACMFFVFFNAPAGQPRNIYYAQGIGMTFGMFFSKLPVPNYIKVSVVPTIVTAMTVKIGVPHPPATAFSVVTALGAFKWYNVGVMFVGITVSILFSMILNNYSEKRQYPTHWNMFVFGPAAIARKKQQARNQLH